MSLKVVANDFITILKQVNVFINTKEFSNVKISNINPVFSEENDFLYINFRINLDFDPLILHL